MLNRQGHLTSLQVTKRSLHTGLNQAAVRSIHRAKPFPPFPEQMPQKQLILEYALNFQLQQ